MPENSGSVAPSYLTIPPSQTPLERILAHETDYWTAIAAPEPRPGWLLFHNKALVPRLDPNHAGGFRAAAGTAEQIVQEIIAFYQALGATPAAYVDVLATPADLVPALLQAGFQEWLWAANDLMLYVGPDEERPSSAAVTLVRTDQDRAYWANVIQEEAGGKERQLLYQLYLAQISDPRMTGYLACVDGRPASRCELFSCNGLGRVEAVRTMALYRGRGLAAALIRQAVQDSLAQGNQLTYIYAEPNGAPQRLYHRLGFRTVAANATRVFIRPGERGSGWIAD
jgi:GNAT superfamily N-acetyltransferase